MPGLSDHTLHYDKVETERTDADANRCQQHLPLKRETIDPVPTAANDCNQQGRQHDKSVHNGCCTHRGKEYQSC